MAVQSAWYVIPSENRLLRWFNLLHWPYLMWHLSYVVMGALLVPDPNWSLLGWTILAFFLGMGIAAHAFDLLKGDPLRLSLSRPALLIVGMVALWGAVMIGITVWAITLDSNVSRLSAGLVVLFGLVVAVGYGLEVHKLHGNVQFALWWAVFPLLVSYFAQAGEVLSLILVPACLFAFNTASAQRVLSNRSRYIRRSVKEADVRLTNGSARIQKDAPWLLSPSDSALTSLNVAMIAIAVVMVMARL